MAQLLSALSTLLEDQCLNPSTHVGGSQLPIVNFHGVFWPLWAPEFIHVHRLISTDTESKNF